MTEENHAISNAQGWASTIVELYHANEKLEEDDSQVVEVDGEKYHSVDELLDRVQEMPLSVQVREDWKDPGAEGEVTEFNILLSTGGPALRIIGDLDQNNQPANPQMQWQDWGTPWTDFDSDLEDASEALAWFCEQFYFGD